MAALLALACSTVRVAPPSTGFEPGQRFAGTLTPGGSETWRLEPARDTFLYLRFDPHGSRAELTVTRGDATFDELQAEAGSPYDHFLAFVAPAEAPSRIQLSMPDGGSYELKVVEARSAGAGDRERAAAVMDFHRLMRQRRPDRTAGEYRALLADLTALAPRLLRWAPEVHPHLLVEQANLHVYLDDFAGAAKPAEDAIRLLQAQEDPSERELVALASSYGNLARVRFHQGKPEQAIDLLSQAIAVYERWRDPGSRYGLALFLSHRGKVQESLARYPEAEADQRRALEICRQIGQRRMEAATRMHLATLYQTTGRIPQAFDQLEAVRPLVGQLRVVTRIQFDTTLGHYYLVTGQLGKAEEHLSSGLELAREVGNAGFEALILTHLGALQRALGSTRESQRHLEEAARLAARHGLQDARFRANLDLARLHLDEQLWREAETPLAEAAAGARESGSPAGQVATLLEQARLAAGLGDFATARRHAREAIHSAGGLTAGHLAHAQAALAEIELTAGRPGVARELLEQALQGAPAEDLLQQASLLSLHGVAARRGGDLETARRSLDRGLSRYEEIRGRIWEPAARTGYLARWHAYYGELIDVLIALDQQRPGQGFVQAALGVSERSKARTLAEILTEVRAPVRSQVDPELVQREIRFGDHLTLLRNQLHQYDQPPDSDRAEVLRNAMAETTESYEAVERDLRRDHQRYAELRYPEPLGYDQIRPLLPAGTHLLHYAVGPRTGHLFVVTAGGVTAHPLPPAEELGTRVEEILRTAQAADPRSRYQFTRLARDMWQVLLARAVEVPGSGDAATPPRRLWIVADGPLHRLPFELLRDSAGRHAVERFEIGYVPSATVLANLDERPRPQHRLSFFALANPEGLEEDPGRPLRPLPGTLEEIHGIANLFPDSSLTFSGPEANEDNLFGNPYLRDARWVHLASHAVTDDEEPSRSAILLAPDADGDRRLEMSEIFDLRLSAEAVVLSACETGLGRQVAGEGVIGLSRAFLYAGSRSLVVSLWPVPDRSTAHFMRRFYEHLATGLSPAAALTQTKRDYITQGWSTHTWAPFIVVGGQTEDRVFPTMTAGSGRFHRYGEGG